MVPEFRSHESELLCYQLQMKAGFRQKPALSLCPIIMLNYLYSIIPTIITMGMVGLGQILVYRMGQPAPCTPVLGLLIAQALSVAVDRQKGLHQM